MALQYSVAIRNAQLDAVESTIGASARLRIYTGGPPANCAAAATGTLLADMTLPADWLAAATGGTKSKLGTWQDASADNNGTAGYFRIWDSAVTTCGAQGLCSAVGGGGELQLDNPVLVAGGPVSIATATLTAANA